MEGGGNIRLETSVLGFVGLKGTMRPSISSVRS